MTTPQDPFAAPDPDARPAPAGTPGFRDPEPQQPNASLPPYGQAPVMPPRNGLGTAALVVGILAVLTGITVFGGLLLGAVAVGLGVAGRRQAAKGLASNRSSATAGLILGIVGLLIAGAVLAAGFSLLNSDAGSKLRECLEGAQTAEEQGACQTELQDDLSR